MPHLKRHLSIETLGARHMLTVSVDILADINAGEFSSLSDAGEWVEFNDMLYFAANDGFHGTELWRTDGTVEGTEIVADIAPISSFPTELTVFNGDLYFSASNNDGEELWKSDGTESGTVPVKDIFEGPDGSFPRYLTVFRDQLYFAARSEFEGYELWKTDGTSDGTELVADIVAGEGSSFPQHMYVFEDMLYFGAAPEGDGPELFKSDGTESGTELVKDIHLGLTDPSPSFPESFFEFQDQLYFIAGDALSPDGFVDSHIFRTDGTEDGTVRISEQEITFDFDGTPNVLEFDGYLYFGGFGPDSPWELYRTNGTPEAAELVVDLAGQFSSSPASMAVYDDQIYFAANDETGRQLWRTNGQVGAENQTERVSEVVNASIGMFPSELIVFADELYLNGISGENFQVWKTDGTELNPITEFELNEASQFANLFVPFRDQLLFRGAAVDTGLELWSITSDGPAAPESAPGDVDGNGVVEFSDFLIIANNFGSDNATREEGDLDNDGIVDFADFLMLTQHFGG